MAAVATHFPDNLFHLSIVTFTFIFHLQNIPQFLPVMRGTVSLPANRDPEVLERLQPDHMKNMCNRMQLHLNASAALVATDQSHISGKLKEVKHLWSFSTWFRPLSPFHPIYFRRLTTRSPKYSIRSPKSKKRTPRMRNIFRNCITSHSSWAGAIPCWIRISRVWKCWTICWTLTIDYRRSFGRQPTIESELTAKASMSRAERNDESKESIPAEIHCDIARMKKHPMSELSSSMAPNSEKYIMYTFFSCMLWLDLMN